MNDSTENVNNTLNENLDAEFEQAAQELGIEAEGLENPEQANIEQEIPVEAQIAIGKQMIGGGLILGFNSFGGLNVDNAACEKFAGDLSACIYKWYPGGLLAFMDKYKEELALLYSGSMLYMAVITALKEKRAANDDQDNDQQDDDNKVEHDAA